MGWLMAVVDIEETEVADPFENAARMLCRREVDSPAPAEPTELTTEVADHDSLLGTLEHEGVVPRVAGHQDLASVEPPAKRQVSHRLPFRCLGGEKIEVLRVRGDRRGPKTSVS